MRRNDLDICADILHVTRTGAKKTQIVYKANLNFNILKKYLRRLVENGLLQLAEERYYFTTRRGIQFLEQHRKLIAPISN